MTTAGLSRVKITDLSLNWPGLVQAVPGNIIPISGDHCELQPFLFRNDR